MWFPRHFSELCVLRLVVLRSKGKSEGSRCLNIPPFYWPPLITVFVALIITGPKRSLDVSLDFIAFHKGENVGYRSSREITLPDVHFIASAVPWMSHILWVFAHTICSAKNIPFYFPLVKALSFTSSEKPSMTTSFTLCHLYVSTLSASLTGCGLLRDKDPRFLNPFCNPAAVEWIN